MRDAYIRKWVEPVTVQLDRLNTKTKSGYFEEDFTEPVKFLEFSTAGENDRQRPVAIIERESGLVDYIQLHHLSFKKIENSK